MNKEFVDALNIDKDDICLFFIEGIGMMIGTMEVISGSVLIYKPRIVQIQQTNPPTINLPEPLGHPKRMFLTRPPVFLYKATDPNLLNLYKETISSIKIVSDIPKNNKGVLNLFGGKK